jgi:predicted alpha-1,2-mannosidase
MKIKFTPVYALLGCIAWYSCTTQEMVKTPADYVNPFIGTKPVEYEYEGPEGRVFPGSSVPWSMAIVTPINFPPILEGDTNYGLTYNYGMPYIYGFCHSSMSGVGCHDAGNITFLPTTGPLAYDPYVTKTLYGNEKASPGFYGVTLTDYNVDVEATSTIRSGYHRYTFPKGRSNVILHLSFSLGLVKTGMVDLISDYELVGYKDEGYFCWRPDFPYNPNEYRVYFYARFNKKAVSRGVYDNNLPLDSTILTVEGDNIGAFYTFDTDEGEVIELQVGLSYVSTENAKMNLEAELNNKTFAEVRQDARDWWNEELSKIKVEGGTEDDKTLFYTSLYRTLLHPSIFNDVNGDYISMGENLVMRLPEGKNRYTRFSLWDTFRNVHPLLSLVWPERQSEMVESMIDMYKESGWLPKWELMSDETFVMIGDPAVITIADTYMRGVRNFDVDAAWEAIRKHSVTLTDNPVRPYYDILVEKGFFPQELDKHDVNIMNPGVWGTTSSVLEYSLADYSGAMMAKEFGDMELHDELMRRAGFYKNLFNPANGFLQARWEDGSWFGPLDPALRENAFNNLGGPGYAQSTAWEQAFFVHHDIPGLIELHGGGENFSVKLQQYFDDGHVIMGDEHGLAFPFLFNYVPGHEWRTQKYTWQCLDLFGNEPGGMPGNDDLGTLSAWVVFSMMGFYPDAVGTPVYQIGRPKFPKVTIELDPNFYKGKTFVIETSKLPSEELFIESIRLNGSKYGFVLDHFDVANGGNLRLNLAPRK